ncbi:hypothetical protein DBR40_09190 [Pedobacter sp. KBW01]|uniref:tape measure protein n=1 Tax=Pedobacter sp. KBW01 TaxID=2153364 RepID=UPI000F58FEA6|nr:tape measure protein [Pedobacter sp. KBW01]RQO78114.1 hypothetical protein DBR40_09190 [Pedobacter sp. KBW01]
MNDNLQLDIDFLINNPAIRDAVRRARLDIKGLADGAEKDIDKVDKLFKKLAYTLSGVFSAHAAKEFVMQLIEVRGQFQQIENSLTTILKSQDAANALMKEWKDLTLRSPYTLSEIAQSGKQLLAYGVDAKNVTKNIEQLANVASGVSQPLGDIAYLYGTLKTQGRAYQMDINQFTNRGIPIIQALSTVMKVAQEDVRGLVEAGKIGFPEVEKAISNMTSAGGQFYNLIGKQAETLPGQINRLKHEWELMLNAIGASNEGVLAGTIGQLANLVEHYEKVIDIIKMLIITYGAYRTAVILNTVATSGASAAEAIHYGLLVLKDKLMGVLTAKMGGLTAATAAYTAVLAALAIVAYAGAQYQTAAEIAEDSLTEARAKGERAAGKEQARLEKLIKVIKDHNATKEAQIEAYEELKGTTEGVVDKFTLEEVAAGKADKALAAYAQTVKKAVSAETQYAEYKALEEKLKNIEDGGIKAVSTMDRLWVSIKRTFAPTSQGMTGKQWWNELFSGSAANKGIVDAEINKYKDAQGKILNGVNGKGVKALIDGSGKVLTPDEDIEIKRAKKYAADLKDVIGNFDKLIAGARSKGDIEKVKEAVTEKLNALAPGDAKIAAYKAKLQKVSDIEAQYGLSADKKSAKDAEKWGEKKAALMDKIADKTAEINAKGQVQNEKEILDARRKYTEMRKEIDKFNAKAPKGQQIGGGTLTVINDLEKKETGAIRYDQDTEKLKITLDKQKQLYSDFEEYKKTFGEAKAKERFAKEVDTQKNYLQRLEDEMADLSGKTDLTGSQLKRKEMLVKEIDDEKLIRKQADDKMYAEAFEAAKSYSQKEIDIKKQYARNLDTLLKQQNGNVTKDQREALERSRDEAIDAAKTEALAKTEVYKRAAEDVFDMTREQVKTELKALKELIASGNISGEAKTQIEREVNKLELTLKIGVDQTRLEGLKARLKALMDELNAKDSLGVSLVSKDQLKVIKKQVAETVAEIKKLENPITGKAKSGFIKGFEDSFGYLKKSSAEVSAGISNDLGRLSGSFSELSQAFGGVDTQAGYAMATIGELTKVGSDAAGAFSSFASGDIVGGITKAVSAVAGLFSIGKRVKEMNAKARQEVEDFYTNAIAGERVYQDLLKQRALQTVRDNKNTLNGIGAEIKLRQSQMADWKKESDEIMLKLAGMSYTASEEYKHGTWVRKAKVIKTYGSLGGMDFEQLSSLLAQGKLEGDAKALVERLKELEQKGYDAKQAMESLADEVNQLFTGTTKDQLTDSLLNMFKEGKTGVKDLADFFESTMQDAALSMFENKVLTEAMDGFYKQFAESSKDGLTSEKIADLKKVYDSYMSGVAAEFENLQKVTGLDLGNKEKSTNTVAEAVKGITSEEAGLLAGQFGGQRIATLEGNQLLRQGNETASQNLTEMRKNGLMLIKIEDNTRRNAESSEQYLPYLKEIASKMNSDNALRARGGI